MNGNKKGKSAWGYISAAAIGFILGCVVYVGYLRFITAHAEVFDDPGSYHGRLMAWGRDIDALALWGVSLPIILALVALLWPKRAFPSVLDRWYSAVGMVVVAGLSAFGCYAYLGATALEWMWAIFD